MKQPTTLHGKLKAINKILPVLAIWHGDWVLSDKLPWRKNGCGMQFEIPKNMSHINPMFQGTKTITFAYFSTLEQCIDNEYKRVVLNKKVRGGKVGDCLVKINIKYLQQVGRGEIKVGDKVTMKVIDMSSKAFEDVIEKYKEGFKIWDIKTNNKLHDNSKISKDQIKVLKKYKHKK
jgi:hypothetical protein